MLVSAAAAAAPAWTWLDENGQRHYSDRPVAGAQQIELAESQTFSRRQPAAASSAPTPAGAAEETPAAAQPYTAFNIMSPAHEQTLWNIGGSLPMQVELQPPLQAPHRLDAIVDGERIEIGSRSDQLTVPDVFRGMHTLQAVVVDASGQEVLRSRAITIMVQQTSILNPNNPNSAGPRNSPGN